jgi:RimJ/RimL family protein N-acetyltransferase
VPRSTALQLQLVEKTNDHKLKILSTQVPFKEVSEARATFAERLPSPEKPWIEHFAIILRPQPSATPPEPNPQFLGFIGITRAPGPTDYPEIGYRLREEFFGKGYGTEAVRAFTELYWTLPARKHINGVLALVDGRNVASWKVLEKVGARSDGVVTMDLRKLGVCDMTRWILYRPSLEDDK